MKTIKLLLIYFLLLTTTVFGRNVGIVWNANPASDNVTQYRIYRIDNNTQTLLATSAAYTTSTTIVADENWVIAMTAYNGDITQTFDSAQESSLSSPVMVPPIYVIPPESNNWAVVFAPFTHPNYPASNVFDKNSNTIWATNYENTQASLPQYIVLDLGKQRKIKGWYYIPRQDLETSGHLEKWLISFSTDNINWSTPISGIFTTLDKATKAFTWSTEISVRFMRLDCLTSIPNSTTHVAAAEIGVIESPIIVPPPSKPTGLKVEFVR